MPKQSPKLLIIEHETIDDIRADTQSYVTKFGSKNLKSFMKKNHLKSEQDAFELLLKKENKYIDYWNEVYTKRYNQQTNRREQNLKKRQAKLKASQSQSSAKMQFTIRLHLKLKVFWKEEKKTYYEDKTDDLFAYVNNREQLTNWVHQWIEDWYPREDDYTIKTVLSYQFDILDDTFRSQFEDTNLEDIPMRRAFPFKLTSLRYADYIDDISYENTMNQCVIKALANYLKDNEDVKNTSRLESKLIASFQQSAIKLYQNFTWNVEQGVTSSQLKQFCIERNISLYGYNQDDQQFIVFKKDRNKAGRNYKAIVYYCHLSHFYLINSSDVLTSISQMEKGNGKIFQNTIETDDDEEKIEDQYYNEDDFIEIDYDEGNETYLFDKMLALPNRSFIISSETNLTSVAKQYIEKYNTIPQFKYASFQVISQIRFTKPKPKTDKKLKRGEKKEKPEYVYLVINPNPRLDWKKVQQICKNANITFKNQSLGTLALQLKDQLDVKKRVKFLTSKKTELMDKQQSLCNGCGDKIAMKGSHIDHILCLSAGGSNEDDNLQILCKSCHIEKTKAEAENGGFKKRNDYESTFNLEMFDLIQSNHAKKVPFTRSLMSEEFIEKKLKRKEFKHYKKHSMDINKCRRNIMLHSKYEFPVFSVLDNIRPYEGGDLKNGLYVIETENTDFFRGNELSCREKVEYGLEHGIIDKSNIKYEIIASFSKKASEFQPLIDYLLEICPNETNLMSGEISIKKLIINTLIGSFGIRESEFYTYKICETENKDEIGNAFCQYTNKDINPHLNQLNEDVLSIVGKTLSSKIESYYPIYLQILDLEAIELHKMKNAIIERGGIPVCLKTDCVSYLAPDKIELNEYFDAEQQIPKYKYEEYSYVKRFENICNKTEFEKQSGEYTVIKENDNFQIIIDDIIRSDKGCLIQAPAGAGKTYLEKMFISHLLEKCGIKDNQIIKLAPTNVSVLELEQEDGKTVSRFCNIAVKQKNWNNIKYIFVDEISMLNEFFYHILMSVKRKNLDIKFIMIGEFHQLPPVLDAINKGRRNCNIYSQSDCLKQLVDFQCLDLTKCRRSDDKLFNICNDIKHSKPIDIKPFQSQGFLTWINLAFKNKTRKEVNSKVNKIFLAKHKPTKTFEVKSIPFDKNSQEYTLAENMPLISRVTKSSLKIFNNEQFVCKEINDDFIVVQSRRDETKIVEVPVGQFHMLFYIAFCVTVHKSQGVTINDYYTIYDWNEMDKTLRYVAMSRGVSCDKITIY